MYGHPRACFLIGGLSLLLRINAKTRCRRDLILAVFNQDGGAHIDPAIDEAYRRLTRENSLLVFVSTRPGTAQAMGNPVLASSSQIAYEVGETLRTEAPSAQALGGVTQWMSSRKDR